MNVELILCLLNVVFLYKLIFTLWISHVKNMKTVFVYL